MNIFKVYFIKNRPLFEAATQTKPMTLVLCATLLLWNALFFVAYSESTPRENQVQLYAHPHITPTLRAGLEIIDFSRMDIIRDHYLIDAVLWFDYDPQYFSADDFRDFSIYRGNFVGSIKENTQTMGKMAKTIFVFKVELQSLVSYLEFPLDKHRLDVVVSNFLVNSGSSIDNRNISFSTHKNAVDRGWEIYKTDHEIGLIKNNEVGYKQSFNHDLRLVFSTYIRRDSPKTAVMVLTPLILIFLMGLISLTFDVLKNFNAILSLSVGSLTGLLFTRNVIDKFMPFTDQFTIADRMYLLFIILTVLVLGFQIYFLQLFMNLQDKTQLSQVIERHIANVNLLRGSVFIFFCIVLLATTAMIFF